MKPARARSLTAAQWAAIDPSPVIRRGEFAFEFDTGQFKIGDGVTAWASLAYAGSGLSSRTIGFALSAPGDDAATGDGAAYFVVPPLLDGWAIVAVHAFVHTAGTTGTSDFQIARMRGGSTIDLLTTKLTLDSGEATSATAATPAVIDSGEVGLEAFDVLRVDVDALSTTKPKGAVIFIEVSDT